jgi:hypothetical protein
LLTIAALADVDTQADFTEQVLELAHQERDERGGMSEDGEALFQALDRQMGGQSSITMRPKELAVTLGQWLEERISSKDVGLLLRRYGFKRKRGNQGFSYHITQEEFAMAMSTYGYQSEPSELPVSLPYWAAELPVTAPVVTALRTAGADEVSSITGPKTRREFLAQLRRAG